MLSGERVHAGFCNLSVGLFALGVIQGILIQVSFLALLFLQPPSLPLYRLVALGFIG
jgi:hypothetical protein